MIPIGKKILIRDIIEPEKKTETGIILLDGNDKYRKVKVEKVSPDSETWVKEGDICLATFGGLEIEKGLWLCNETILEMKL